jgi:hypothetical protein
MYSSIFFPDLPFVDITGIYRGGGGGDFDPNLKKSWLCSYVF